MHPWIVLEFRNSAVAATLVVLLHAACIIRDNASGFLLWRSVETIWILRYAKKEIRNLVRKFVAIVLIDCKRYTYEWITRDEEYFINFYSTKVDISHQLQVQFIIIKSRDKLQLFFLLDCFVPFIVSLITKLDERKYEKNQNRSDIFCIPIQRSVVRVTKDYFMVHSGTNIYIYRKIPWILSFPIDRIVLWERKEVGFSVNVILLTRSYSCLTGTRLNCKFMHVRVWHARYLCCLCFFLYSWRDGGFISSYLVYLRQRVFEYTVTNEKCLLWNFKLVGYNCISMFFFVVNKRVV